MVAGRPEDGCAGEEDRGTRQLRVSDAERRVGRQLDAAERTRLPPFVPDQV